MSLQNNNNHGEPLDESSYYGSGQGLPLPPQPQSCSPSWSRLHKNSSSASQKVAQASSKVLDKIPQPTKLSVNVFATRSMFDQQSSKENVFANGAQAEATTSIDKSSTSKNKKGPLKRSRLSSTSDSKTQNISYTKRTKKNQEKSLRKIINACTDKEMLLCLLNEDLNKNKEKSNDYVDKDSQTEAFTAQAEPPVNLASLGNIALMAAFEKIIKDFSILVSDTFLETMLGTFGDRLEASKVLELLKQEELKIALVKKFPPIELLNLVSVQDIAHYITSKKDPNISVPLLNILLEKGPKVLTKETKSKIKNVLMEKFSPSELNNLMHEILNHVVPTPFVTEVVIEN